MAKQSGLAWNLYFNGVDLSNDVGAIAKIGGGPGLLDVTGLDKSAHERIGGLLDGSIDFAPWFNPTGAHATLSPLPTSDVHILVATGITVGSKAACEVAKQNGYNGTRDASGHLVYAVANPANGSGVEWCDLLTAGKRTDVAATNGTALDFGSTYYAAGTVTSASAANPTVVLATAHGLVSGDSVLIAGTNKAALNLDWQVTVTDANHFTVPCDLSGGAAGAGTFTKTSTDYGIAAYCQTFSFTGTSNTPKLQHSADNGVTDAYADIAGGGFTAITSAPNYQRIVSALTIPIRRYVRANSVGSFNPSTFAIAFTRRPTGS